LSDGDLIKKLNEKLEELTKRVKDYVPPTTKLPPAPPIVNTYYRDGKDCYTNGQYKKAIEAYEKALKMDRRNKHAWNELGLAYNKIGERWKALDAYYHAIELDPKDPVFWINAGLVYKLQKDYENAIKTYKAAIEIDPDLKEAWSDLGSAYDKINEDLKAIYAYKHAIVVDPNYVTALNNIGASYNKTGEYDTAIEFLHKATIKNPELANPWNHLGYAYYKKKDYPTSIKYLEKAVDINSKYVLAWINLAKAQYAYKAFKEAYLSCDAGLKLEANNISALKLIEKIKKKMGLLEGKKITDSWSIIKEALDTFCSTSQSCAFQEVIDFLKFQHPKIVVNENELKFLIMEKIKDGALKARFHEGRIVFAKEIAGVGISTSIGKFKSKDIEILRGGDWKVEGNQSVFHYKVKVKNNSPLVITNIQILLTSVPEALDVKSDRYKIEVLKPNSFQSPTFRLIAKESCVGDTIESIVTYMDPTSNQQTIKVEPFKISYVCNLLTPKKVSKKEFDEKVDFMEEKKLLIDSDLDINELASRIAEIVTNCNFSLIEGIQDAQSEGFKKIEGFAEGLYDKQDVALSVAVKKVKKEAKKGAKKGAKVVVKAMSDKMEKVTDILKDLNIKMDDIKSDTELIKQYTSQIEGIFDKVDDLEGFLLNKLGSDFQKIKGTWHDFKEGKFGRGALIGKCISIIGKKFIKKIIKTS
jgi:tetratricopeptide (TPR) repeat protein